MKDEELDDLIQKAEKNDRKALVKLIGYLISLDRDLQDRLEHLMKLMNERSPKTRKTNYIA